MSEREDAELELPRGLVELHTFDAAVRVVADESVYPLDAVYGAAYTFIDRCYVFIDRPDPSQFRITLSAKDPDSVDESRMRQLAGELSNELLACAWRHEITRRNRAVIESVTMQAFAGALGPPSLDELEAFDFTEEPFDDPLGIATSWEEKYKKKPNKPDPATESDGGEP